MSFRSALTAALATRMVPVLARDARPLARRAALPAGRARRSRLALVRAVTAGALDRAVDVAATLEVRGYGARRRGPRGRARPWSRHDLAFAASAAALVVLGRRARLGGWEPFEAYPRLVVAGRRAECSRSAAALVGRARCCRSPIGGGSGDERARRSTA